MTSKLTNIQVGSPAPDFTLTDTENRQWSLNEKRGRIVALLFYPGDETLVCTKQLCSVRNNWSQYLETGAEVVGISPGTKEEHQQFAERHNLPMPLLVDDGRQITQIYGKHWWMPVWATRAVVVVDARGIVRYQNVMVRALRPTDDEVLAAIHLSQYDVLAERRHSFISA